MEPARPRRATADAEYPAHLVRAHWGIENSLHWVLDVAFCEDECRKHSIAGKRLLAGWDTSYMEKVLFTGQMRLPWPDQIGKRKTTVPPVSQQDTWFPTHTMILSRVWTSGKAGAIQKASRLRSREPSDVFRDIIDRAIRDHCDQQLGSAFEHTGIMIESELEGVPHMTLHDYSRDFIARCITEQNAFGTLVRLCEEVGSRPSGSDGERRGAELMGSLMSRYGLDVTTAEFSYDGWERGATRVSYSANGDEREIPAYPLGFCPPAELVAEVVDVGAGSEAEFAAADVAGKIALVSSATAPNTPPLHRSRKYELATSAGAAGFAFYLNRPGGLTVMGSARLDATGCGPIPAVGLAYEDAMAITRADSVAMTIVSECRGVDAVSRNTIGLKKGDSDEEIVVCGHIDSWFSPGAVDNGSGVVSVVELARLLAPYKLRRSVRFIAFGSEELGILGSKAYVDGTPDLSPVRLVLNLDCPAIRDGRLTVITNENDELHAFFSTLAEALNLSVELRPERAYYSDHAHFRENGIASAQFIARSDLSSFLHTAYDTLDKIEPASFTIPLLLAGTAIIESAMSTELEFSASNR